MRTGRPTKFLKCYVPMAARAARLGYTQAEIADFLDVGIRTLERWIVAYPDLRRALKELGSEADRRMERSLYERGMGVRVVEQQAIKVKTGKDSEKVEVVQVERQLPGETTAMIFWLKNRRKELWRDRYEFQNDQPYNPTWHDPTATPTGYERKPAPMKTNGHGNGQAT